MDWQAAVVTVAIRAPPTGIEIRKATLQDSDAFLALRREAILHGCAGFYSTLQLQAWTSAATDGRLIDPLPSHFYVARLADEVVATGLVDIDTGRIDAMFVSPKHAGRGIGKAVMAHLERVANGSGVTRLTLDATVNAASFYRSVAFVGDARSVYESPRGVALECASMAKQLGEPDSQVLLTAALELGSESSSPSAVRCSCPMTAESQASEAQKIPPAEAGPGHRSLDRQGGSLNQRHQLQSAMRLSASVSSIMAPAQSPVMPPRRRIKARRVRR